jgi:hypothetical protein
MSLQKSCINTHFFIPLPGTPLAHATPGAPDRETLLLLENLTSEGLEVGRWKGRLAALAAVNAGAVHAQERG